MPDVESAQSHTLGNKRERLQYHSSPHVYNILVARCGCSDVSRFTRRNGIEFHEKLYNNIVEDVLALARVFSG